MQTMAGVGGVMKGITKPLVGIDQRAYWEAQHERRAGEHFDLEGVPNQFATRCVKIIPCGGRVVEIGPGYGRDARYFVRETSCQVVVVEIAKSALRQLGQAAVRDGTWRRILPLARRVQDLRPADIGEVDAFYARSSLHLSNAELAMFLDLVDATLKPGGHLMIEGKTPTDPKIRRSFRVSDNLYSDHDGHVRRAWTEDGIRAFVSRMGYSLCTLGQSVEEWGGTSAHFIHCISRK